MPSYRLKITDSNREIQENIVNAIYPRVLQYFERVDRKLFPLVKNSLSMLVSESPTWRSLNGDEGGLGGVGVGSLRAHFGLENSTRIQWILQMWINGMRSTLRLRKGGNDGMTGRLYIYGVASDYGDVLSLNVAKTINVSRRYPNGQVLPWLDWLLKGGADSYVYGFDIKLGNYARSRSGSAIMIEESNARWEVPPQHAGSEDDNFITKILDDLMDKRLEHLVTRALNDATIN